MDISLPNKSLKERLSDIVAKVKTGELTHSAEEMAYQQLDRILQEILIQFKLETRWDYQELQRAFLNSIGDNSLEQFLKCTSDIALVHRARYDIQDIFQKEWYKWHELNQ